MDQKLVEAWIRASKDLGIEVIAPFVLELEDWSFQLVALVKNFGSEKGVLVTTCDENEVPVNVIEDRGYYWSAINPEAYFEYNRILFIDTLDDWGWYGKEGREPRWYTGKPWS